METAFVLPLVLLVLLGGMELGRIAWTLVALQYGTEEGARCAAVRPTVCATPALTAAYAASKAGAPQITASAFVASTQPCGSQVVGEVRHQFIIKGLFPAPLLSGRSCRL